VTEIRVREFTEFIVLVPRLCLVTPNAGLRPVTARFGEAARLVRHDFSWEAEPPGGIPRQSLGTRLKERALLSVDWADADRTGIERGW